MDVGRDYNARTIIRSMGVNMTNRINKGGCDTALTQHQHYVCTRTNVVIHTDTPRCIHSIGLRKAGGKCLISSCVQRRFAIILDYIDLVSVSTVYDNVHGCNDLFQPRFSIAGIPTRLTSA